MSEELEMQRQAQEGREAKELLENPIFVAAVERVERELFTEWRESAPADAGKREGAYYTIQALNRVKRELTRVSDSGVLATAKLRQKGKR